MTTVPPATRAFTTDPIRRYDIQVPGGSTLGCDLDDVELNMSGEVGPANPGASVALLLWARLMHRYHQDVRGLLLGHWDGADHLYQELLVHVGRRLSDRHLTDELDGITMGSADGFQPTKAAGVWLQPTLIPTIGSLGLAAGDPESGT